MPAISACPECEVADCINDVAIHLMCVHGWMTEKAIQWLKEQMEEEAFYKYGY